MMTLAHEYCLKRLSQELFAENGVLREKIEMTVKAIDEAIRDTTDILEEHDHANS